MRAVKKITTVKADFPFIQPVLSSNGTMGGDSFACTQDKYYSAGYEAYKVFDNDSSTNWNTWNTSGSQTATLTIYNPVALNITSIAIVNYYDGNHNFNFSGIVVSGSNDGNSWESITSSITTLSSTNQILSLTNDKYYKYYKFVCTSYWSNIGTVSWNITATYKGTKIFNFALPIKVERSYWKYKYIPWENPTLSANGTMGGSEYACSANTTTGAAWQAFDNNTSTIAGVYWGTGGRPTLNLILYCPNPVKVTEAKLWWISDPAQSSSCFSSIYCYGSNDNENWVQIGQVPDQCGLAGHWTTIDCSSNTEYYHYYKFTSTQSVGASYEDSNYFGEIKYTGTERIVEPATESDYDYYIDTPIIKAFGDN